MDTTKIFSRHAHSGWSIKTKLLIKIVKKEIEENEVCSFKHNVQIEIIYLFILKQKIDENSKMCTRIGIGVLG